MSNWRVQALHRLTEVCFPYQSALQVENRPMRKTNAGESAPSPKPQMWAKFPAHCDGFNRFDLWDPLGSAQPGLPVGL